MAVSREEMQAELDGILAEAEERAEYTKAAEERSRYLNDPVNEFGHGYTVGIANAAGIPVDVANALLNAGGIKVDAPAGSGENIKDVLAELQGMPEDMPMDPSGLAGGAAEALGVASVVTPLTLAPFMEMAMDPNFEQKMNVQIGQFHGTGPGTPGEIPRSKAARLAFLLKMAGQRIAKTAVEHPKTFIASETAAAAAAGAAMEFAEEKGGGSGAQMAAGLAAGMIGGLSPSAVPRIARGAWRWGMKNFNPFRKAGAEPRAAEQMQIRSEDPQAAAMAVEDMIDPATGQVRPEYMGLTPARVTGEERLMAQEARVLADDPRLDAMVRDDLEAAIKRAEGELRSLYDTPRGKEDWELAVFQRVAPDDVEIVPGTAEEMLEQLYTAFRPMYETFKGYPVRTGLYHEPSGRTTTLEVMMGNVQNTNRVLADDATRAKVGRWLDNQYEGLHRSIKTVDGVETFKSEDLLKVRSNIRTEARKASKRNDLETVDLLKIAEEKINVLLKDQLPEGIVDELGIVDSHYRNYKIAEDAVYRGAAGDRGLTPDSLLSALRASASSKGGYARGEQLELRSLAASGRPIAGIMKDPERVRRAVATMSEEDLLHAQQDFFDAILQKATLTDDTGLEVLSGRNVRKQLEAFDETARALRMDESSMTRAQEIADRLIIAQRPRPGPVEELYEDAPADILQLLATLIGAKHGQNVAGRGMGSSLVLAGWFAKKARAILGNLTTNQARILLANAQTDPELYAKLLTATTDEAIFQEEATQYLKVYLAQIAQRGTREAVETPEDKKYEEELNRLRQEIQ